MKGGWVEKGKVADGVTLTSADCLSELLIAPTTNLLLKENLMFLAWFSFNLTYVFGLFSFVLRLLTILFSALMFGERKKYKLCIVPLAHS